jgi:hypothetical protein
VVTASEYCYVGHNNKKMFVGDPIHPLKEAFRFEVGFDFTQWTFMPITPAEVILIESLTKREVSLVMARSNAQSDSVHTMAVAIVSFRSYQRWRH